jgi:hypothetical protein
MKQTAVEWLINELQLYYEGKSKLVYYEIIDQAKEMEKQQIIDAKNDPKNYDAYWDNDVLISSGEVYYNETYV